MEEQLKELMKLHSKRQVNRRLLEEQFLAIEERAIQYGIEVWRIIKEYPNYSVSSIGKVKKIINLIEC